MTAPHSYTTKRTDAAQAEALACSDRYEQLRILVLRMRELEGEYIELCRRLVQTEDVILYGEEEAQQ